MRDAGITTVGEFHYVHHEREGDFALDEAVIEAARDVGIRMVLLYSYYATGAPGRPLEGAPAAVRHADGRRVLAAGGPAGGGARPGHADPGRRAAQHSRGEPGEIAAIHRRGAAAGPAGPPPRRGAAAGDRGVARGLRPDADGGDPRRGRGRRRSPRCTAPTRPSRDMARFLAGAAAASASARSPRATWATGSRGSIQAHAAGGRLAIGTDSNNRLAMLEEMRWMEYGQRLRGELAGRSAGCAGGDVAPVAARRGDHGWGRRRWACRPGGSPRGAGRTSPR